MKMLIQQKRFNINFSLIYYSNQNIQISFPEFEQKIQDVLDQYDAVFPKLNWSSAKVEYICMIDCYLMMHFYRMLDG
jgi:hypothetical protein